MKDLKDIKNEVSLPPNVLALLEGFPVRPPAFPDEDKVDEENRIIPGGPSSSTILSKMLQDLRETVEAYAVEFARVEQKIEAARVALLNLTPIQNSISLALASVSGLAVSGNGAVVDFFSPGSALLGSSNCSYETLYGQATLPYLTQPQSQIVRSAGYGARPGTLVRYSLIGRSDLSAADLDTYTYDESDPEALFAVDGRLDTSWAVPIDTATEDLLVNVVLPPTLGINALVNSLAVIPWPIHGTEIVEVWIRDGGDSTTTIPGWTRLSLAGQLGYDSTNTKISRAGAHRLFFSQSAVKEIVVRLRPLSESKIGLVNLDCWAIEFNTIGSIVIDAAEVNITSVRRALLSGINPSSLLRLPVSLNGTEITISLSSASTSTSPVINTLGIEQTAEGDTTGFDYDVFAP